MLRKMNNTANSNDIDFNNAGINDVNDVSNDSVTNPLHQGLSLSS